MGACCSSASSINTNNKIKKECNKKLNKINTSKNFNIKEISDIEIIQNSYNNNNSFNIYSKENIINNKEIIKNLEELAHSEDHVNMHFPKILLSYSKVKEHIYDKSCLINKLYNNLNPLVNYNFQYYNVFKTSVNLIENYNYMFKWYSLEELWNNQKYYKNNIYHNSDILIKTFSIEETNEEFDCNPYWNIESIKYEKRMFKRLPIDSKIHLYLTSYYNCLNKHKNINYNLSIDKLFKENTFNKKELFTKLFKLKNFFYYGSNFTKHISNTDYYNNYNYSNNNKEIIDYVNKNGNNLSCYNILVHLEKLSSNTLKRSIDLLYKFLYKYNLPYNKIYLSGFDFTSATYKLQSYLKTILTDNKSESNNIEYENKDVFYNKLTISKNLLNIKETYNYLEDLEKNETKTNNCDDNNIVTESKKNLKLTEKINNYIYNTNCYNILELLNSSNLIDYYPYMLINLEKFPWLESKSIIFVDFFDKNNIDFNRILKIEDLKINKIQSKKSKKQLTNSINLTTNNTITKEFLNLFDINRIQELDLSYYTNRIIKGSILDNCNNAILDEVVIDNHEFCHLLSLIHYIVFKEEKHCLLKFSNEIKDIYSFIKILTFIVSKTTKIEPNVFYNLFNPDFNKLSLSIIEHYNNTNKSVENFNKITYISKDLFLNIIK